LRYSFLRRSFSLAGSGAEGGGEEGVEAVEGAVAAAEAAAAAAFAGALGFLGARAVFAAIGGGVADALPPPPSSPAPTAEEEEEEEEEEETEEETEANCRLAIEAASDDDGNEIEASQRPIAPAFAALLALWSKLM
jgi:microcompartment protein CcmL/EutN